jgi:hypothetical protein
MLPPQPTKEIETPASKKDRKFLMANLHALCYNAHFNPSPLSMTVPNLIGGFGSCAPGCNDI